MSVAPVVIGGAIIGSVAGSVAGAAVTRWPDGRTLTRPVRSGCDSCGLPLEARDLIPVISWMTLRGRCRHCGGAIDARLPAIEAGAAVSVVAVLLVHGWGARSVLLAAGAVAMLAAAVIDLEHRIVPDRLTWPLAVIGVAALAPLLAHESLVVAFAWSLGVPLALLAVTTVCDRVGLERPVGLGDVKLLVGVLALASLVPSGPPAVLLVAILLGGSIGIVGILTGRLGAGARLPFAPAIAAGYLTLVVSPEHTGRLVARIGGGPWHV